MLSFLIRKNAGRLGIQPAFLNQPQKNIKSKKDNYKSVSYQLIKRLTKF